MDLEKYLEQYSKYQNQIDLISNHYSNLDEAIRRIDQIQKIENLTSAEYMLNIQDHINMVNNFLASYDAINNRARFHEQLNIANKVALINSNIEKIQNVQSLIEKVNLQNYSNVLFDLKVREILKSYNDLENLLDDTPPAPIEIQDTKVKLNELLNLKKLITIENVLALITFLLPIHSMLLIFYPELRGESERIHNLISELVTVALLLFSNKSNKD
ncbi:MAG: hypothetical protein E6249_02030 [Peptoniphilus grossensis]|uniref:hypothetical protein n=1 Tax=Peptoniphilus grossensis TaxID=1465756 RepID=UPI00258FF27E|nr:hypothetical protein [Peptoniphilus grossensis]MDU5099224.1 hypothetical protein [Peptoniphilus grossensis]